MSAVIVASIMYRIGNVDRLHDIQSIASSAEGSCRFLRYNDEETVRKSTPESGRSQHLTPASICVRVISNNAYTGPVIKARTIVLVVGLCRLFIARITQ